MALLDYVNPTVRISPYDYFKRVMIYFNNPEYWWNNPTLRETPSRVITGAMREQTIAPVTSTDWSSVSDTVPLLEALKSVNSKIGAITGGAMGGMVKYFDVKGWKSTSQLRISFKLHFDTITFSKWDVWNPILALWGYTLPEQKQNGIMSVPGVNLIEAIKQSTASMQSTTTPATPQAAKGVGNKSEETLNKLVNDKANKLVTVQLCGFIYLKDALLEKAVPTFSTNTTESGFPLWGEVDCEVSTLATADLTMISDMRDKFWEDGEIVAATFM